MAMVVVGMVMMSVVVRSMIVMRMIMMRVIVVWIAFMFLACMGMIRVVMSAMRVPMPMMCMAEGGHANNIHQQSEGADSQ